MYNTILIPSYIIIDLWHITHGNNTASRGGFNEEKAESDSGSTKRNPESKAHRARFADCLSITTCCKCSDLQFVAVSIFLAGDHVTSRLERLLLGHGDLRLFELK